MFVIFAGGSALDDVTCSPELFHCRVKMAPGKWCISRKWVCDGETDCEDGSDELQNCGELAWHDLRFGIK